MVSERAPRWLARGWSLIREVAAEVDDDQVPVMSAALAFYALLALFPALIGLVSFYALFADPVAMEPKLAWVASLMPPSAGRIVRHQLDELASGPSHGFGLSLIVSVIAVLWSASTGVSALLKGVSLAYFAEETRSFLRLRLMAIVSTVAIIGLLALGLFTVAAVPVLLGWLLPESWLGPVIDLGRWPLLAFTVVFGLELLYRYGPDRTDEQRRRGAVHAPWGSPGAWLATLTWLAASFGFSAYVTRFGTFNETYGALGAVVVLLLWLWIGSFSALLGAELNAVLERRTRERPPRDR